VRGKRRRDEMKGKVKRMRGTCSRDEFGWKYASDTIFCRFKGTYTH
jgi:hypothetical protein